MARELIALLMVEVDKVDHVHPSNVPANWVKTDGKMIFIGDSGNACVLISDV